MIETIANTTNGSEPTGVAAEQVSLGSARFLKLKDMWYIRRALCPCLTADMSPRRKTMFILRNWRILTGGTATVENTGKPGNEH